MNNFRAIDGSGNNPNNLGETGASLRRILNPAYESNGEFDDLPRGIIDREDDNPFIGASSLPNPREISNTVSAQEQSATNYLDASDWIWQWGQFLDHDLDLNEGGEEPFFIPINPSDPLAGRIEQAAVVTVQTDDGEEQLLAIQSDEELTLPFFNDTPVETISLEELITSRGFTARQEFIDNIETQFDIDLAIENSESSSESVSATVESNLLNPEEIPFITFTRIPDADDSQASRQYINDITAFIDGSQVYGSEAERAEFLRADDGTGKLKSQVVNGEELLPLEADGVFFAAGDVRANEQVGLTSAHTLFLREHNRVAEEIASRIEQGDESLLVLQQDSGLETGDFVYESARKVVGAEIQFITYNEYLPLLLGDSLLDDYSGYDSSVNPNISVEFANVSFRLGHSQLSSDIQRVNANGTSGDSIALADAFFDPQIIKDSGVNSVLLGLPTQVAQEVDNLLIDGVRNFLFPAGTGGFDLAAVNIQRGRDVGLPSYNDARRELGLATATSFLTTDSQQGITSDPEIANRFASIYDSVEDVDLWIGGISEDPVNNGLVGELFSVILTEQFENLRSGDRFFYLNDGSDLAILAPELENTTLSGIIQQNTSEDVVIQENAFLVPSLSVEAVDGNGNTNSQDFTVSLSDVSGVAVTVDYETINGVGTAGEDYIAQQGILTFNPGEQTKTISVELLNDAVLEDNETFLLRLSNASNNNIDRNLAVSMSTTDLETAGTIADDVLDGSLSRDFIKGDDGNDTLSGRLGNDLIDGGNGNDVINGDTNAANQPRFGGGFSGSNPFNSDRFRGSNDTEIGGNGNDTLNGNFGSDTQLGGDGNDLLIGDFNFESQFTSSGSFGFSSGDDVQIGGNGNDTLTGGSGNDKQNGTGENLGVGEIDELTGGADSDTYVLGDAQTAFYAGRNDFDYALITDFEVGQDTIELNGAAGNYVIAATTGSLPQGTGIYLDTDNSGDFTSGTDELIAISTQTFESFDNGFSFV